MTVPETSLASTDRGDASFRQYLAYMSDEGVLRLAQCLWWEALQHGEPLWPNDRRRLDLVREDCVRRGTVEGFDALEKEMRAEVAAQGRPACGDAGISGSIGE
jgi:hypothetical protein